MSALRARVLTDPAQWRALHPAWDRLLATVPGKTPLQSARLLDAWWRHHGAERDLYVVLVERRGDPVGFVPLQRRTGRRLGRRHRVLELLGMPNELLRPALVIAPDPAACLPVALRALDAHGADWDALDLEELVLSEQERQILDGFARPGLSGIRVERRPFHPCPYLRLDRSFDAYCAGLGRSMRRKIRYLRNKLARAGKVEVRPYESPEAVERGLDTFVEIESRSWKREAGVGVGASPASRGFYRELLRDHAETGQAHVLILWLDDAPIAGTFAISADRTYYAMQIAHDRAFAPFSPGTVLESFELEGLMGDARFARYEFFGGALANKTRWTNDQVETERVRIERTSLHARVYAGLRRMAGRGAA